MAGCGVVGNGFALLVVVLWAAAGVKHCHDISCRLRFDGQCYHPYDERNGSDRMRLLPTTKRRRPAPNIGVNVVGGEALLAQIGFDRRIC